MENTQSSSSDAPILALPSPKPHKRLKGLIFGTLGVLVLGGGVAAYFVTNQMMNAAAGIPIPDLATQKTNFVVPAASLMANATYTRSDGQIVHYVDRPSIIEKAWTEKGHHILIKFTEAFGLTGEVEPEKVIFGLFDSACFDPAVTVVKDVWYYVYTSPTYEVEKKGTFPVERFRLGNCRDVLSSFGQKYTGNPKIKAGDLVYVAIPPAEVVKLEAAKHGGGTSGKLRAATSKDTDGDGLLDLVEENLGSKASEYDTDLDGIGDGLEVAGGQFPDNRPLIPADVILWSNPDTDGDGLGDALELGFTTPHNPDPAKSTLFVADSDPSTVTKPNVADTDGGGKSDGEEDANKNGRVDEGETDPNNKDDDILPPLPPLAKKCDNAADDDSDGLVDIADPGCHSDGNAANTETFSKDDDDESHIAACGNGAKEGIEECDDGNQVDADSCTNACKLKVADPICGNSVKEGTEECDDGNAVNTDTCNECKLTFCGDRVVQNPNGKNGAEECDEDTPICTADCKKIQFPEL